jgi:capsid protein
MRTGLQNDPMAGFAQMQSSYQAAKRSGPFKRRRAGIPPQGAGADWHYSNENDYLWMGEIARDLDRNDMVIGQLLDRYVDNVIGEGFTINPQTGDEKLDEELKARATEEFNDPTYCDPAGELSFYEQEQLVAREVAPGDVFGLPIADDYGTVQLNESHLCRSPTTRNKQNIVLGVQMNARTRMRENYWFTREPIDPLSRQVRLKDLAPVRAYTDDGEANVFHVYRPKRPSQTRGVTALAPVIDAAGLHDDLQFAALLKAQLSAFFLLVRNRDEHFQPGGDQTPAGVRTTDPYGVRGQQKLAPGAELTSEKGETIAPWSPNIPNAEFFPHVKLVLTFLGINLGMPLVLVLLDASETNFSGYRGAIDQARLGFRRLQRQLILRWHRPYWRFKLNFWADQDPTLAALRDASKPGSKLNLFRHRWNRPAWQYIEPGKDAAADLMRESNMLRSPSERCQEQNREWPELVKQCIRDRRLAIVQGCQAAADVNKEFSLEGTAATTWRDFAPLPSPERMAISMNVGEPDPEPKPTKASNAQRTAA